jgi:hypothetical protein
MIKLSELKSRSHYETEINKLIEQYCEENGMTKDELNNKIMDLNQDDPDVLTYTIESFIPKDMMWLLDFVADQDNEILASWSMGSGSENRCIVSYGIVDFSDGIEDVVNIILNMIEQYPKRLKGLYNELGLYIDN